MVMKKLLVLSGFLCLFVFFGSPVFAVNYAVDVLEPGNPGGWTSSLKTFDTTYKLTPGHTAEIDVWIENVPGNATAGGVFIDFRGSTNKLSYISCQRYNNEAGELPGPWQSGAGVVVEPEPGMVVVVVGNLGSATPVNGKFIIAKLTVNYYQAGTATIAFSSIPEVNTWGPAPPWDDGSIIPASLSFNECLVNEDCIDPLYCNGVEACVDGACVAGANPCPDNGVWCDGDEGCNEAMDQCVPGTPRCQDDGLFCNGDESCDEENDQCLQLNVPCPDDGDPCTNNCVEATNTCYVCNAMGISDPCCETSAACDSAPICNVVINDFYVNGTTGSNANDGLTPATAWKTITHALSTIPTLIMLNENNRALVHVAASTYNTTMGGGDVETFPLIMRDYVSFLGAGYNGTIINADQTGSVIKSELTDNFTIDGFTITGGRAIRGGGFDLRYSSPAIKNCRITGNTATDINGGGIYLKQSSPAIINCLITGNSAPNQNGGAISCADHSEPTITNCTIMGNEAGDGYLQGGGALYIGNLSAPTVTNCILWDNYPDEINVKDSPVPSVTYSCIEGGYTGTGNTALDPKFFGTTYHLTYLSPCIDSAISNGAPDADIDGHARFDPLAIPNTGAGDYPYYDRGTYEYTGDSDGDGILDDWDNSGVVGDTPCTGGVAENCDDNCTFIPNTDQADGDADGIGTVCDNCPVHPNGPARGTCGRDINPNMILITGPSCAGDSDCGSGKFCLTNQEDSNNNGIGDVCDCEGNFDCDNDVDADDVITFLTNFGRNRYFNPCTSQNPCNGNFDCDDDVDAHDVTKFLEDFGRNPFNNPCPSCTEQPGC